MASPTNRSRVISGLCLGMSWFRAMPARNAPMMGASPASDAVQAEKKTAASRNANAASSSRRTRRKKARATLGSSHSTAAAHTRSFSMNVSQNAASASPLETPWTTASTKSESRSVTSVAPVATTTALFFEIPSRPASGSASKVWLPTMEPNSAAAGSP